MLKYFIEIADKVFDSVLVVVLVVVLGIGLVAYNANPVPSSNQFRLGDYAAIVDGNKGGVITSENGGELQDNADFLMGCSTCHWEGKRQ